MLKKTGVIYVAGGLWALVMLLVVGPVFLIGLGLTRLGDLVDDLRWRIRFWQMRRPRKWRPSDKMIGELADVIVIGRTLRTNVEYFQSVARTYSKDSDGSIVQIGRRLLMDTKTAKQRLGRLLIGLELRIWLRRFAWPVLRRDNSDLETFWKVRFEPLYTGIEDGMRKLTMAIKPELYQAVETSLAVQRPRLEPPKTHEDRIRARVQRFKAMLAKRSLVDFGLLKGIVNDEELERLQQSGGAVDKAYSTLASTITADLPESEREREMRETDRLLRKKNDDQS